MAVLNAVRRVFFHFCEDVADDFWVFLWFGASYDGDERELWPGESVVKVVFQKVVFREVGDIAGLDGGKEGDVGGVGAEWKDIDHFLHDVSVEKGELLVKVRFVARSVVE